MSRKIHTLYVGDVSDAPGMDAKWIEQVCYLGTNRWWLMVKGLSFDMKDSERKGTKSLIYWCLEQDSVDPESADLPETRDESSAAKQIDEEGTLSGRAARLLEIAREESATYCVACLEGFVAGTWPPQKRLRVARILSINGVVKRGVCLGVFRPAYTVETTYGSGYMEQPGKNGYAALFLHSGASYSVARFARIPMRLLPRLKELQAEFEALKDSLIARSSSGVKFAGKEN